MQRRLFTVDEARSLLPEVQSRAAEIATARADLTELAAALEAGTESPLGGVAEAKAHQARLHELLGWFPAQGIELKGWAPVLVDFPAELGGADVLLCWLEGEPTLDWYHRVELGFAGRRKLP